MKYIAFALCLIAATPASAQQFPNFDPIGDIVKTLTGSRPAQPAYDSTKPHARAVRAKKARGGPAEPAVRAAARSVGLPEEIAVKAAQRESGNTCSPNNRTYKGPLQILPATARGLGYKGSAAGLNSCGAGLRWGIAHLYACFKKVHGNPAATLRCHRTGLGK